MSLCPIVWVACVLFVFACLCLLYHKSHLQRFFCGRGAWGSKADWTRFVTFQLTLNRFISFCVVLNESFCIVLCRFVTFHIVRIWVTKSIRAVRLIKHSAFVVSYRYVPVQSLCDGSIALCRFNRLESFSIALNRFVTFQSFCDVSNVLRRFRSIALNRTDSHLYSSPIWVKRLATRTPELGTTSFLYKK